MRLSPLLIPLLWIACATRDGTVVQRLIAAPGDCYNPIQYGGFPDDGRDDRVAIQAAIDAVPAIGGVVCIGPGRWLVSRAPITARNRHAGISIHGQHLIVTGAGSATTLALEGDQLGINLLGVIAIDPGAADVTIQDLAIDTSLATNTSEQTHGIQIGSGIGTGNVSDIRVERVRFTHPLPPLGRSGDCIRLLGNPASPEVMVQRVTIIGSTFDTCARSSISYQRNVIDLVITGNQIIRVGDQAIDGEPSGSGKNGTITIVGNLFHEDTTDPLYQQGDYAISIAGLPSLVSRVVVASNVFEGRGIVAALVTDFVVTGNVFDAQMEGVAGVIDLRSTAERVIVANNIVRRRGAPGALVRAQHNSSGLSASRLIVSSNVLQNDTAGNGIDIESAGDMTIAGNAIFWPAPSPTAIGIRLRTVAQPADGVMIRDNRIDGVIASGIYLAAVSLPLRGASVTGNVVRGAVIGLHCLGVAAAWPEPMLAGGNRWPGPPSCPQVVLMKDIP